MKKILFYIILIFEFLCLSANESGYQKINFTISPNISINELFFAEINKEKKYNCMLRKRNKKRNMEYK